VAEPPTPITVLLTNDDGVDARGLAVARDALSGAGMRVAVVAPEGNHTCGSHRVSMRDRIRITQVTPSDSSIFSCSGTPADCVRLGVLSGLVPRPDVVVAGINHGANAGDDIHYSGTVAAAAEAALLGLPAIAASQHGPDIGVPFIPADPTAFPFASYIARLAHWAASNWLPDRMVLNVNLPLEAATASVALTRVGRRDWTTAAVQVDTVCAGQHMVHPWSTDPAVGDESDRDFAMLMSGTAAVNVLSASGGLHDVLDRYRHHLDTMPLELC
jgi:5'-nucleotidase